MLTLFLFVVCALLILAVVSCASHHRGYKTGHEHGYGKGFDFGHREADNWWVRAEDGVTAEREKIWREDGAA